MGIRISVNRVGNILFLKKEKDPSRDLAEEKKKLTREFGQKYVFGISAAWPQAGL